MVLRFKAQEFRRLLAARGMTMTDVAEKSGVGLRTIYDMEERPASSTLKSVAAIAGALGVPTKILLEEDGNDVDPTKVEILELIGRLPDSQRASVLVMLRSIAPAPAEKDAPAE